MKTYEWNTAKGAKVELTANENAYPQILKVNGIELKITGYDSFKKVVNFKMNGNNAGVEIPENIYSEMMIPVNEKLAEIKKAYDEEKALDDAVKAAMRQ